MNTDNEIHEIFTKYVQALGQLINFLNKKMPEDANIIKAKNLYVVAKNNEPVLFEDTHYVVLEYHREIAADDKKVLLSIDFNSKIDGLTVSADTDKNDENKKDENKNDENKKDENKKDKNKKINGEEAVILKTVISNIQKVLTNMNDTEWKFVSRLLKDLLSVTSRYVIKQKQSKKQ